MTFRVAPTDIVFMQFLVITRKMSMMGKWRAALNRPDKTGPT